MDKSASLINTVGEPTRIREWQALYELPDDSLSIENGIIIDKTKRWALCVDPEQQANSYIKNYGTGVKAHNLFLVVKASKDNLTSDLELGVKLGKWILVENCSEELSPELEPVLLQQKTKKPGATQFSMKIGDKVVD